MAERSFGADSTSTEVADGIDLTGKLAIVTGASGGLGAETARVLASRGAAVTLACGPWSLICTRTAGVV